MSGPQVGPGFGGLGVYDIDDDIEPLSDRPSHDRQSATRLTGTEQPTWLDHAESRFQQVEEFADEMVLTQIEKHTIFGRPITRRMSLMIVIGLIFATILLLITILVTAMSSRQSEPSVKITAEEGQRRYQLFTNTLLPLAGSSITKEGTPEEKALHWLSYTDPKAVNPRASIDVVAQRFVLATFYFATKGEYWEHPTGSSFLSYKDECDWNHHDGEAVTGAQCNVGGSIDRLTLNSVNLDGTVPRNLGLLTHLTHVDFSENKIRGELPSSLGNLGKLTHLDLTKNLISTLALGTAKKWTSLQTLKLGNNALEGGIPYEYFVNLASMKTIDLSNNNFTGIVHDDSKEGWGTERLEELNLSNNRFVGSLPRFLQKMDSLKILDLSGNGFVGSFPMAFLQMTNLESLDLSRNHLLGSFPAAFGANAGEMSLSILRASSNELVGSIPTKIGAFTKLSILQLDDNGFYGPLPSEIGKLKKLQMLNLDSNKLAGTIPKELGSCTSLHQLELANNRFESRIPSQLGNLRKLKNLDLRNNQLIGSVPTELGNLPELSGLYLSGNSMMGDFDAVLCDRSSSFPPWNVLETDCMNQLLTCSCCTSCCKGARKCCLQGSKSCDQL